MRQPSAGMVVLVQLRTGRGDRLHDPFLSCVQLDTATRQQPGPPPPEQANTVKTELNRRKTANPEQGRRDFSQIPTSQDRVGDVRHVSPVSMRPQARHSDALQTIPQRPHGTLRATVEQQAHRQRHPVTVIGRFAWKNSTRDTQSATGQPLVVDGGDQALEIGLEAVGADLDRLRRASTAIDGGRVSPVGISASSTSTGMIWTPGAIAVSVPSQMKSPGSSMRWRRRLSVMLSHLGR